MEMKKYDTIIVGGGIAGLTSAVYLAKANQKILLIEKNNEFGGLVSTFKHKGYQFEAGVRALESAGIIIPMLQDLGIELNMVRSKVSVGVENLVVSIEDKSSIDDYQQMLTKLYPDSADDIDHFIRVMLKIMKHLDVLYGIENPAFKDLKKDTQYIFKKLLPWLPRFLFTVRKINKLNKPIEPFLETIIHNQSLRDIISQHFFKGTPTFFALSYFTLYLDYFYPMGGSGKLAEAIVDKIQAYGGELKPSTLIEKVDAKNKVITDQDGNQYGFSNLIWAADLKALYANTNHEGLQQSVIDEFEKRKQNILAARGSESVFSLYLEIDLPLSYFGEIANGHFFYTPNKKGLGQIHSKELDALLKSWKLKHITEIQDWLNRFLNYNTYEISIPGLKDPSMVPEGKTGMIVSFIIDYNFFRLLQESGWYDDFRKNIEQQLIEILSASIYPKLKEHIDDQFSFTPISIKNRIASTDGSIVGWSFEDMIPVVSKIQYSDKSVLTPIPEIYQAGQWAYSPAGVPMSILTGKLAADRVLKNK
jgi:phytoene dehydrogenase-like protein